MADRNDDDLYATLRQITQDFVDAANRGDRAAMEALTDGKVRYEIGFAFEQKLPDFIAPPFGASLISAAEIWGPAEIEQLRLEAVGERHALAFLGTSFPPRAGETRRRTITNTSANLIFQSQDGRWLITGAE